MSYQQNGFSLIELMVTVAIVGVLATMANIGFASFQTSNQLTNLTSRIAGVFRQASNKAAINKVPISVEVRAILANLTTPPPATVVAEHIWFDTIVNEIDANGAIARSINSGLPNVAVGSSDAITVQSGVDDVTPEVEFANVRAIVSGIAGCGVAATLTPLVEYPLLPCGVVTFNNRGELANGVPFSIFICSDAQENEAREVFVNARGVVTTRSATAATVELLGGICA